MTFDVVTLVYNRQEELAGLLRSLAVQTQKPNRIWVIDNGSTQPVTLPRGDDFDAMPISLHRIEKNQGISGYNVGFKKSDADVVVVVDSDVELDSRALAVFCEAFTKNSDLIFAGAKILDFHTKKTMFDNPIHGAKELVGGGHCMVQFNGCCFAARRKVFLDLGGFDPRLFLYVNEWDLHLRAFQRYSPEQIRYFPEAVASHKTAPSSDRSQLYQVLVRRNEFWVRWKYYPLGSALDYSFRFIGGSLKRLTQRQCRTLYGRYLIEGLKGLFWVLKERAPLPVATYQRLMAMRAESKPPENEASSF